MRPIKFLGLILAVLGIVVLFYNPVLGGIIIFLGAVILIAPKRMVTRKRVVHEFKHKIEALRLEEHEKALKKKHDAIKKAREKHIRAARK